MREASWTDAEGRQHAVWLPDSAPDSEAQRGLSIGPPPLDALGLPRETTIRLHNELFARRILTEQDARRRAGEIVSALAAALRADAMAVMACYAPPSGIEGLPPEESPPGALAPGGHAETPPVE